MTIAFEAIEDLIADRQIHSPAPMVAFIREAECIGCTKCIQACPVDAILGTSKHMHSILNSECIGCGLCVEPCPVDCIELQTLTVSHYDPIRARDRFQARQQRLLVSQQDNTEKHQQAVQLIHRASEDSEKKAKQAYIQAAIARVKAKRHVG